MRENNRHRRSCDHCCHMESEHDGSLADLLDRCGRYFAHRIGGSRRGQDSVMAWLAHNPDVTQKELAEGLGIMPASLSEVLMKLERKGYVARVKDENDRRFVRVRLTEEGEQALDAPQNKSDDPFASLSPEEQETLTHLLSKLLADWEVRCVTERKRQGRKQYDRHGDEHSGHGREHCGGHTEHSSGRDDCCRCHGHH